jgi:hypothetical protein
VALELRRACLPRLSTQVMVAQKVMLIGMPVGSS